MPQFDAAGIMRRAMGFLHVRSSTDLSALLLVYSYWLPVQVLANAKCNEEANRIADDLKLHLYCGARMWIKHKKQKQKHYDISSPFPSHTTYAYARLCFFFPI